MKTIPFLNPAAQFQTLREELLAAAAAVLEGGRYILGPEVRALESEIAELCGSRQGIGVNSGSDALTLALHALGVGPGDEVITSPFSYIAPAESIHQLGAKIVFADIHPRFFTVEIGEIRRQITERTKVLLPVHLFGQGAPIREMIATGIPVVEDCAQALGAWSDGKPLAGHGIMGCVSFYPTKNLGACGDGGMIVTSDDSLADSLRRLRVHGITERYHHDFHGYNSRLDELQAALLRVKLHRLTAWNHRRQRIAQRYFDGLAGLPLELPLTAPGNVHVYHVFALLTDQRDALQSHLAQRGVPTLIYYPTPLHLQRCYADRGWKLGDFPVAESVARRILPLPMYPELTDDEVDTVVAQIQSFFN